MINLPPELKFPVLARPKLRGARVFILNGEAMIKQDDRAISVLNRPIADILSGLPAFDGFVVVGNVRDAVCSALSLEAVMSVDTVPEFVFHVVDLITTGKYAFKERYAMYKEYTRACRANIQPAWHRDIADIEALNKFEADTLFGHYPGIVVREPDATVGGIWSS